MKKYLPTVWRIALMLVLLAGIIGALLVWIFMPHGFPVAHPRFWLNSVAPGLLCLAFGFGFFGAIKKSWPSLRRITLLCAFILLSVVIAAKLIFPISFSGWFFWSSLCVCLIAIVFCAITFALSPDKSFTLQDRLVVLLGIFGGVFFVWSQRAQDPATRPNSLEKVSTASGRAVSNLDPLELGMFTLVPKTGEIDASGARCRMNINPLLSVDSHTPDRGWEAMAPTSKRQSLVGFPKMNNDRVLLNYGTEGQSISRIELERLSDDALRIDSQTQLYDSVYSSSGSVCHIQLMGVGKIAVTFSPCPDTLIEILPSEDNSFALPSRLAYVDEFGNFRVVEALFGTNGPYRVLAEGAIDSSVPLGITITVDGEIFRRVTISGWAEQASLQRSSKAGWGLPENAIEFSTWGGPAGVLKITNIGISLAGSSAGRGFDSVGYAKGTYRTQIVIDKGPGSLAPPDSVETK